MATAIHKAIQGRIIVVQEDRFRMVDETGKGYLFTLFRKARASQQDLQRWRNAGFTVMVEYEGEPNLATGMAHKVTPIAWVGRTPVRPGSVMVP